MGTGRSIVASFLQSPIADAPDFAGESSARESPLTRLAGPAKTPPPPGGTVRAAEPFGRRHAAGGR